jgi:hypothetical protein
MNLLILTNFTIHVNLDTSINYLVQHNNKLDTWKYG